MSPPRRLTRVSLEVWAVTAVKGDWSGSGTSMVKGEGGDEERMRSPREMQIAVLNAGVLENRSKVSLST